jgi:hypothetical protein
MFFFCFDVFFLLLLVVSSVVGFSLPSASSKWRLGVIPYYGLFDRHEFVFSKSGCLFSLSFPYSCYSSEGQSAVRPDRDIREGEITRAGLFSYMFFWELHFYILLSLLSLCTSRMEGVECIGFLLQRDSLGSIENALKDAIEKILFFFCYRF